MDPISLAILTGAAGAAAGGGISKLFGGKPPQQQTGYDVVQMPQYSFTEPRLRLQSEFISGNIQRMMQGELPAYYEKFAPKMKAGLQRGLRETYWGRPGERTGLVQRAIGTGAGMGLGAGAAWKQGQKQMRDYATKEREIDEYMAGLGFETMRRDVSLFPQLGTQMPRGPESQVVTYGGGVGPTSGQPGMGAGAMASLMENIPWENLYSSQAPTTPSYDYGYNRPLYQSSEWGVPWGTTSPTPTTPLYSQYMSRPR